MSRHSFDHRFTDEQGVAYWVHAEHVAASNGRGHVPDLCVCTAIRVSPPQTIIVNPSSNSPALHVAVDEPELAAKAIELGIANGLCVPRKRRTPSVEPQA